MKKLIRILINFSILTVIVFPVTGQDIHFSNFYNVPLILNPANTGNYIGNWRLISNYRQQGNEMTGDYQTKMLAFDMPVYYYKQMGSVGLVYINDISANNTLFVNKLFFSSGHYVKVSSKSYFHLGLQFGFVHKKFSLNKLSFPDQFDMTKGYFNPDLPTSESDINQNLSYVDLNWGLIWSRKTGKFNSEIGIAMFHYNTPNERFSNYENELSARYQAHGYLEINLENKWYLKPKSLFTFQNKVNELLLGQDFGKRFNDNNSMKDFKIGVFYRGGFNHRLDAFIVKTGFQYKSYKFEISYENEIPDKTLNRYPISALEFSLNYTRPSTNLKNKTIPCDTF